MDIQLAVRDRDRKRIRRVISGKEEKLVISFCINIDGLVISRRDRDFIYAFRQIDAETGICAFELDRVAQRAGSSSVHVRGKFDVSDAVSFLLVVLVRCRNTDVARGCAFAAQIELHRDKFFFRSCCPGDDPHREASNDDCCCDYRC